MRSRSIFLALLVAYGLPLCVAGKEGSPHRAKPPQFSQADREVFFDDVRNQLIGKRPDRAAKAQQVSVSSGVKPNENKQVWSTLIDADSLMVEIKRVANQVSQTVLRAGSFKSEGSRLCQRDFRLLAIWFGIVREYGEEVRWQKNAEAMRVYLLEIADKCEEPSDESFAAAQEASELLAELMRGQTPSLPSPAPEDPNDKITELGDVMQRMKLAAEETLTARLVGPREFRKGRQAVAHEAQVLAVLAHVIQQEGFDFSDDESYLEYAQQLQKSAIELTQAAREGEFETAESAGQRLKQSCTGCHEDFRG